MPNNIAVSITADVADLTVKRAIMSAELKQAQKDLNDFAKTANTSGTTDALKTGMLGAVDSAARLKNQIAQVDREIRSLGSAGGAGVAAVGEGAQVAEKAMTSLHGGTAGVTRELIVMAREAARGNFSRLTGSATILAGRLGVLTPAVVGTAAAFAAVATPFAIFALAAEQGSEQLAKFQNAMEATNGYAGVTISQLQAMSKSLSSWAQEGVGAASKELMALAASGRFTGDMLALVGADSTRMAQLTGESADKFNAEFERMNEGVAKFAADYQAHYGQLTTAQFEYIQKLEQQGQKESAEYALAKDIYDYLGQQAPEHLGYLERAWRGVGGAISSAWDSLKAFGRDSNADKVAAVQSQIAYYERLKQTADGSHIYDTQLAALYKQLKALEDAGDADVKRAKAAADATERQKEGVAAAQELAERFENSKTSGEKLAATIAKIKDELAKADAANPGDKALHAQEAAAAIQQAQKSDAVPKVKAPRPDSGAGDESDMQALQEKFDQEENAHNTMLRDMAADELAYWSQVKTNVQGGALTSEDAAKVRMKVDQLTHEQAMEAIREEIEARKNAATQQIDSIEQASARQKDAAEQQVKDIEGAEKKGLISKQAATDKIAVLLGQQETDADNAANQILAIRLATDKAIESLAAVGTAEYREAKKDEVDAAKQASDAIVANEKAHNDQLQALYRQNADNQAKAWQDANKEILSAENTLVSGLIDGRETLGQLLQKIALQTAIKELEADVAYFSERKLLAIEGVASDAATERGGLALHALMQAHKTAQVATSQAGQTAATAAGVAARTSAEQVGAIQSLLLAIETNEKKIYSSAAAAAASAYQAMAGIPVIGPARGVGAPATTFAAVEAFGNLASLDVGTNYVPRDMVANIHQGERVIPKADNARLESAIRDRETARGAPATAQAASGHTFVFPVSAIDQKGVQAFFDDHAPKIVKALNRAARNGAPKPPGW